jgi:hypothetical protein
METFLYCFLISPFLATKRHIKQNILFQISFSQFSVASQLHIKLSQLTGTHTNN